MLRDLNQSTTVSARQRGGGVMSGEGEKQKDLERNELAFFATKIRKTIEIEEKRENEKIVHGLDRTSNLSVAFVRISEHTLMTFDSWDILMWARVLF